MAELLRPFVKILTNISKFSAICHMQEKTPIKRDSISTLRRERQYIPYFLISFVLCGVFVQAKSSKDPQCSLMFANSSFAILTAMFALSLSLKRSPTRVISSLDFKHGLYDVFIVASFWLLPI